MSMVSSNMPWDILNENAILISHYWLLPRTLMMLFLMFLSCEITQEHRVSQSTTPHYTTLFLYCVLLMCCYVKMSCLHLYQVFPENPHITVNFCENAFTTSSKLSIWNRDFIPLPFLACFFLYTYIHIICKFPSSLFRLCFQLTLMFQKGLILFPNYSLTQLYNQFYNLPEQNSLFLLKGPYIIIIFLLLTDNIIR